MSKYYRLRDYLLNIQKSRVTLTFKEIEDILESKLPKSARNYREWWGNDTHHTQARNGWLAAGWQIISVDFLKETVEFIRIEEVGCKSKGTETILKEKNQLRDFLERIRRTCKRCYVQILWS